MKYLKKIFNSLLYICIFVIVLTFIITFLNYFNIINDKITAIFKIIIPIICLLIGGIKIGRNSIKHGFIEGLKLGLIFSILLIIFNVFINNPFKSKYLLFYIILISSSILGSMIGINKKKK